MKKTLSLILLVFGLNQTIKSQNSLEVSIDPDLCLDVFTVHFSNDTYEVFGLGCNGRSYDLGSKTITYFIINGTDCFINNSTGVLVNDGKRAEAEPEVSANGKKWTVLVHLAADNN